MASLDQANLTRVPSCRRSGHRRRAPCRRPLRIVTQHPREPELAFAERRSAVKVADLVETEGFEVKRGVAGLDTAFTATYGADKMVIGLCAEHHALPEIDHA